MAFNLSSVVNEEFKMMGLSLRGDAMSSVVAFLERADDANAALSQMLDALDAKALSSSIVAKDVVDDVVHAIDRANGEGIFASQGASAAALDDEDGITVVDAFKVPRYAYDTQRRVFHEDPSPRTVNATLPPRSSSTANGSSFFSSASTATACSSSPPSTAAPPSTARTANSRP